MKVEYVVRKNRKVISRQVLNPMQAKKAASNKAVLDIARSALSEKLKSKGKHRIEIKRADEKVGEWTCVPAPKKKKKAA